MIEKKFEVEHRYVDFQLMIICEKLRTFVKNPKKVVKFDDLYLARLIYQNPENADFYVTETIQKLINFQYSRSVKFF